MELHLALPMELQLAIPLELNLALQLMKIIAWNFPYLVVSSDVLTSKFVHSFALIPAYQCAHVVQFDLSFSHGILRFPDLCVVLS